MSCFGNPFYINNEYYLQLRVAQLTADGVRDENGNAYTPAAYASFLGAEGKTVRSDYEVEGRLKALNPNE